MPIVLQLDSGREKVKYPFKFNHAWLDDENFKFMVKDKWLEMNMVRSDSLMLSLMIKLKSLKSCVLKWDKERKFKMREELYHIERDSERIYPQSNNSPLLDMDKVRVKDVEAKKLHFLLVEEETWRQ